jgi:hypothetical protein
VRGGTLETIMGQYFRKRLEAEGLFSENHQPEDGAVRFYANSKQRTIATSTFFSAGLLPVWDTPVETHVEYDTMDPVFSPVLHFVTPDYEQDVISQISEMGGDKGLEGIHEELLADGRIFSFLCGHDSNIASVLAALGVKEYSLSDTIEPKTPIGVKLVFARFLTEDNEAWDTVSLVYQSTQQLRDLSLLTPENPPMEHFLEFEGVETNADHMIAEDDLLDLFDNAISAYDELMEKYTDESLEPAA